MTAGQRPHRRRYGALAAAPRKSSLRSGALCEAPCGRLPSRRTSSGRSPSAATVPCALALVSRTARPRWLRTRSQPERPHAPSNARPGACRTDPVGDRGLGLGDRVGCEGALFPITQKQAPITHTHLTKASLSPSTPCHGDSDLPTRRHAEASRPANRKGRNPCRQSTASPSISWRA
jgi:hypothetical protein